jgi:hypothetical protein
MIRNYRFQKLKESLEDIYNEKHTKTHYSQTLKRDKIFSIIKGNSKRNLVCETIKIRAITDSPSEENGSN